MKATYKVLGGQIEFEVEGSTEKEIFKQFAKIGEVFDQKCCGHCKKTNIQFVVRNVDDPDPKKKKTYDYYEMRCSDCGHRLEFGQLNEGGGLFPKRKLPDGSWDTQNKGWGKFKREDEPDNTPSPANSAKPNQKR